MFCRECGTQLKDDARFCKRCGWKCETVGLEPVVDNNTVIFETVDEAGVDNTPGSAPVKKKKSIGIVVIIVALIALMAIGGAIYYFFFYDGELPFGIGGDKEEVTEEIIDEENKESDMEEAEGEASAEEAVAAKEEADDLQEAAEDAGLKEEAPAEDMAQEEAAEEMPAQEEPAEEIKEELPIMEITPSRIYASSELDAVSKDKATYFAENVSDGKLETAWVEGADGLGIGESLTLLFPSEVEITYLDIYSGYMKTKYRYTINGKPTYIRIETCGEMNESELIVLDPGDEDVAFEPDEIDGTRITFHEPVKTDYLTITILDAVGGTKYEDVAISEIKVYGR